MSYGVCGLLAFVGVLVWILSLSHRVVWRAMGHSERSYAALLLSFIFANIFVGAMMQSHISIFPMNVVFWMCSAALLKITFNPPPAVEEKGKVDLVALIDATNARRSAGALTPHFLPNR